MTAAPKRTVVWRHGTSKTDKPLEPGQHRCSVCHRGVALRKSGIVREHNDKREGGRRCAGAGLRVDRAAKRLRLAEIPAVVMPLDRGPTGSRLSPQPVARPTAMCREYVGPYCPGGRPKGKQ